MCASLLLRACFASLLDSSLFHDLDSRPTTDQQHKRSVTCNNKSNNHEDEPHIFISSLSTKNTPILTYHLPRLRQAHACINPFFAFATSSIDYHVARRQTSNSSWPKPKHTIKIGTQTQTNKSLPTVHESSLTFSIKHSRENIDEKRRHIIQNEKEKGGR